MTDLPENLDLKFLPDWLKESESQGNRYANFAGEDTPRRDRDDRRGRGPRPPQDRGPRPPRRDERGPRGPRPGGDRGPKGKGGRRDERGPKREERRPSAPPPPPSKPVAVKVEFVPEPGMLVAIAKEMRSSHRAYPLFSAAKMILNKPQLHRVRITSLDPAMMLHQLGDGPISSDRSLLERDAFRLLKDKYYREEVQQNEPPKGNFSNVARLRASGLLLGPTNYHSYQPALRRIYEERYSRRMPFSEFQHREIEVVTDEQTINEWKEKARSVVTYVTTQEAEPLTFKTQAEAEAHFRQHYLPREIRSEMSLEALGAAQRSGPDRALGAAIGDAFDREFPFPASVVNVMRPVLADAGLTFFKHRKRVVYASAIRPVRPPEDHPARETVSAILRAIEAAPRCSRHDLAVKVLGENFDAPEKAAEKTALAADLHYLLLAGHVIEFVDGRLDLPLAPKTKDEKDDKDEPSVEEADHLPDAAPAPIAAIVEEAVPAPAPENSPAETALSTEPASGTEQTPNAQA